jgi:hypothetical protein
MKNISIIEMSNRMTDAFKTIDVSPASRSQLKRYARLLGTKVKFFESKKEIRKRLLNIIKQSENIN